MTRIRYIGKCCMSESTQHIIKHPYICCIPLAYTHTAEVYYNIILTKWLDCMIPDPSSNVIYFIHGEICEQYVVRTTNFPHIREIIIYFAILKDVKNKSTYIMHR